MLFCKTHAIITFPTGTLIITGNPPNFEVWQNRQVVHQLPVFVFGSFRFKVGTLMTLIEQISAD